MSLNKPIVYTHRTHVFNEIGDRLAEGCYWVNNPNELESQLTKLMEGKDNLIVKRQNLMDDLYVYPKEGPEGFIKNTLKDDLAAQCSATMPHHYYSP